MSKPTGGKALQQLLQDNPPPMRGGWVDTYNGIWNEEIAGTIKARIDGNNQYFVTALVSAGQDQATRKAE